MTQTQAQGALIDARHLGKRYGQRTVLASVSLTVEPGTILGLIGRNGAGKSTLLECLLGLRPADAGEVRVFGRDPMHLRDADKALLGYVPQLPDAFGWMTLHAMLTFVATLYPTWDPVLVARLLARWKLDASRRLITLSPGERQQMAIIRALGPRPRLLVLDEPAAALDPLARRELLREIVDMAGESGTTVVFSTHIVSDLERVASHIALLHDGTLRVHASLDTIKDDWRRVWWPPTLPMPAEPLPGELARRPLEDGAWSLVVNDANQVLSRALPTPTRVHPLNLEDLFVELAA